MSPRRKLVMLGEMAVGKTSIVRRMVFGRFDGDYKGTLGHDIFVHSLTGLGPGADQSLDLAIWDTDGGLGAGAFYFDASVRGASGVVIVADANRPQTITTMASLCKECEARLPGRPISLVFNKVDVLDDPASYRIPADLAAMDHASYKASAKTGENIEAVFVDAANAIIRRGL